MISKARSLRLSGKASTWCLRTLAFGVLSYYINRMHLLNSSHYEQFETVVAKPHEETQTAEREEGEGQL